MDAVYSGAQGSRKAGTLHTVTLGNQPVRSEKTENRLIRTNGGTMFTDKRESSPKYLKRRKEMMKKPVYVIAVIGLLYCTCNPNPLLPNSSIEPAPNPDNWWRQRHEEKTDLMSRENDFDLVFIGGSTTQSWESQGINSWNEMKALYKIANLGFGGDRTENALWRLRNGEFPANINVQYVVLHIGNNNSGAGHEPEDTAAGIGEIIRTLHENAPSAKIILVSILPVGADNSNAARKRNNRVNEIIKNPRGRAAGY
jgi:hypothetical protein